MPTTKSKKGGLLIPNSMSLFPLVKSVNKTLPVPETPHISKDAANGTYTANTSLFQDYAKLATDVNTNGKKIGYYKLFPQTATPSSTTTATGGGKSKNRNKKKTSKTLKTKNKK
jgi:hypothetical protein